ncbi:MAG: ATP-binding protein [Pyrinomonadaceae bacterium]
MTFRARLTLWFVITLGLLLVLTAGALVYVLSRETQKKFDTALWMLGASESEAIAASLTERGLNAPDKDTVINHHYRELLGYDGGRLEKYVTVVDAHYHVADFTDNLAAPLPFDDDLINKSLTGEAAYQTIEVENVGWLRVVYMPVRGAAIAEPFVVIVGLPEKFVGEDIRGFRQAVIFAVLILLVLTALSSYFLAARAVRPIEKVIAAAESITARNLKEQLPEQAAAEPIGRMVAVFNQMLSRLETAFETQQRFADRAAHELRTPLTILKGENQVLLNRRRSTEEYETQLRSNLEEVEKMQRTIDELLLFARYEAGETEMPRRRVRLDSVVESVVKDLRPLAEKNEIEFIVETATAEIFADEQALGRLTCKLLENALFYTPRGGRISVKVFYEREQSVLLVEDTGVGISPEDLPHIFERFFRSSSARRMRPAGAGIGLALAAVIARLHNAEIEVESDPQKGTRFIVKFSSPSG